MATLLLGMVILGSVPILANAWHRSNFFTLRVAILVSVWSLYVLPLVAGDPPAWTHDDLFIFTLMMGLLGFGLAIAAHSRLDGRPLLPIASGPTSRRFPVRSSALWLLAGIHAAVLLISIRSALPSLSLQEIVLHLLDDRVGAHLENPLAASALFRFVKTFLTSASLLLIMHLIPRRPVVAIGLFGLIVFETVLTTHTRYVILTLLVLPLLYWHFERRRLRPTHFVLLGLSAAVLLALGNFVRGGYFLNSDADSVGSILSFDMVVDQLQRSSAFSTDYFYEIHELVEEGPESIEYGRQYVEMLPIAFVPRAVWPEKPTVSYFHRVTELIEGVPPGVAGQKVYTTTLLGEAYHQFHLAGVLLTPFVYVALIAATMAVFQRMQHGDVIFWLILIHVPMDLRGGLFSLTISLLGHLFTAFVLFMIAYGKQRDTICKNQFPDYF